MEFGRRTTTWALAIVVSLAACGQTSETEELQSQIEELEAQLEELETTAPPTTPPTSTTAVAPTSTSTTEPVVSTTLDSLDPEVVRSDFETMLEELKRFTLETVASEPTGIVPYSEEECSRQKEFGPPGDEWLVEYLCNDHELTFAVGASWEYDVSSTNSIVSPYSATTVVPFSFTRRVIDETGTAIPGHTSNNENSWIVHWKYNDGEWLVEEVTDSQGAGWGDVGYDLIINQLLLPEILPYS